MPVDDLVGSIQKLRREKSSVIFAHNYQRPEIQDVADLVGDSLQLARSATQTDAEVIVLCGVHFMAETAAILNPQKKVLIPDKHAGCPMANMVSAKALEEFLAARKDAYVISYVNTTAEIKAMSDICCTSSNAEQVVSAAPGGREIVFLPDRNLGHWVMSRTGRKMTLWDGYCPTHARILPEFAEDARKKHPGAELCVHPECSPAVVEMADFAGSTSQILNHCTESSGKAFIIGTELGILHGLKKQNPDKEFFPVTTISDCPNMKLTTLEKLYWSLRDLEYEVTVPSEIAQKARLAVERMIEVVPPKG